MSELSGENVEAAWLSDLAREYRQASRDYREAIKRYPRELEEIARWLEDQRRKAPTR